MKRPYTTQAGFASQKDLNLKAVKLLKENYNFYAKKNNGLVSNHEINKKIFPQVKKELQPLTPQQDLIIESLFDSFFGMLVLIRNSEEVFKMLEIEAQGKM